MRDSVIWFLIFAALAAGVAGLTMIAAAVSAPLRAALVPQLGGFELPLAAFCSVTTMLGSLWLSGTIPWLDAPGYVPCTFCWYQRIAAYPLAVLFVVAAVRRDRSIFVYSLALAIPGALLSLWHIAEQNVSALQGTGSCDPNNPCSAKYIDRLGFVSIPVMALGSFLFIIGLSAMTIAHHRSLTSHTDQES
jgi:disulfide bond formation protein DsbB